MLKKELGFNEWTNFCDTVFQSNLSTSLVCRSVEISSKIKYTFCVALLSSVEGGIFYYEKSVRGFTTIFEERIYHRVLSLLVSRNPSPSLLKLNHRHGAYYNSEQLFQSKRRAFNRWIYESLLIRAYLQNNARKLQNNWLVIPTGKSSNEYNGIEEGLSMLHFKWMNFLLGNERCVFLLSSFRSTNNSSCLSQATDQTASALIGYKYPHTVLFISTNSNSCLSQAATNILSN